MNDKPMPLVTIPVPIKCETVKRTVGLGAHLADIVIGNTLELMTSVFESRLGMGLTCALFLLADALIFFVLGTIFITVVIAIACGYGSAMADALPEWMYYAGGACGVVLRWLYIAIAGGYIKFKCITGEEP